jgi:hypothetical protein
MTDSKVVGIHGGPVTATSEPNPNLVAGLENLLERARSGQLQSFIGTGFIASGDRCVIWCDAHPDVYQMMGSIEWLKLEYAHRHTEAIDGGRN